MTTTTNGRSRIQSQVIRIADVLPGMSKELILQYVREVAYQDGIDSVERTSITDLVTNFRSMYSNSKDL